MANVDGADSDVVHHEANTKAIIGSDDLGVGDLYICKRSVMYYSCTVHVVKAGNVVLPET